MKNYLLFVLATVLLLSCENSTQTTRISELYALGDGENTLARQEYEWLRQHNPTTGLIPNEIAAKEFAFITNFPNTKSITDFSWQQRGPINVGGRTRALALDINNEDRILAGGVSGGLWLSDNGGESFSKVTTNLMLHSITSIVQDLRPGFQNIWYYGTGELSGNSADLEGHGIYKSLDNGMTWNLLAATSNDSSTIVSSIGDFRYVHDVKVNPVNGEIIAATFAGIFLSQDFGNTWQNVLTADPSPDGFGYRNFGNQTSVDVNNAGIYYATLSADALDEGIWRSEDGLNWTELTPPGFPITYRRIESAFNPLDQNELLFLVDASTNPSVDNHELWHYAYLTGNGTGSNGIWQDRTANLPDGDCLGFYTFNFGYYQSQNSYNMLVSYHPTEPDLVFIGGTNLYRSTDAFQTNTNFDWIGGYQCDSINPSNYIWPNHHPDNHVLVFLPSDDKIMISAHDGGLSKTTNCLSPSIEWQSLNNGYGTSQFYTVAIEQGNTDSDVIIGGLQDNGTWLTTTTNPNTPWVNTFYGDGAYCAITEDATNYYVSWQGGKTFKFDIDENGQTTRLTRIDPVGGVNYSFINAFILDPNNDNTMYLAAGSYLWRNDSLDQIPLLNDEYNPIDLGWTRLNESVTSGGLTPNRISALGMSAQNSDLIYYGGNRGIVFKLSGLLSGNLIKENITRNNLPSMAYISSIVPNPNNADEVLLSYSNYEVKSIFYSNDAGATWENVSGSLEENPDGSGAGPSVNWMHWYQDEEDTIYFAGTTSGLFATTLLNGENTIWERQAVGEIGNVPVTMITSRTFDRNIVVATHGGGIFSTKEYNVGIGNSPVNKTIQAGFPFPNPSNEVIQIDLELRQKENLTMRVFNVMGVHIETIADREFGVGEQSLKWYTSEYSDGIYFVTINNGQSVVKRKFLVKH